MLENLHVKDLALINESDISFKEGFNILTGETGAGKSIVLGSINLALGAKTGANVIRSGKESALIELSFSLNDNEINKVKEMDLPIEEDGVILLQRKIMPNKSVCRINGETVTLTQLRQLSTYLLNMYGQHEHQNLLKASTYSSMLDDYAGDELSTIKDELKLELSKYHQLLDERNNNNTDENIRKRQIELLEFEINEIDEASLSVGEDEELEKRFRFLSNARKIMENVSITHEYINGDSKGTAIDSIGRGLSLLQSVSDYDDEIVALVNELSQIDNLINDFSRSLNSYINNLVFDEEEFRVVEDRLNTINRLKDKYNCSIEDILKLAEVKNTELLKLSNYEEYLNKLNNDIKESLAKVLDSCKRINKLRNKAKEPLKNSLIEAMKDLNFLDVKLDINIIENEEKITDKGFDEIEFLISLNPGEELRPMQEVASGGELSRIMLAFKSVFATKDDVSTLIFDEIDTGISGVTAYKVAEKMRSLSKGHQIICITHLPQIAAMADNHFLIEKSVEAGRTQTDIISLDYEASVKELARMLGSDTLSDSAINNARELKKKAKED